MAFLFEIVENVVTPNVETLMISPFKEIWERDTNENKEIAKQEFAFIEFMSSHLKSNPYKDYPEDIKASKVIEGVRLGSKFKPDKLIKEGIKYWEEFQMNASPTYSYYIAAKIAAENMKKFFREVDVTRLNQRGSPIYKPKELTSALLDSEKVVINLAALKSKVEEELFETTKNRGGRKLSPFAEPESMNEIY